MKKSRMKKLELLFPIDLQTFAEKTAIVDGQKFEIEDEQPNEDQEEVEIEDDDPEVEFVDDNDDEDQEDAPDEPDQPDNADKQQKETTKNPTANAVIAERRKWQERVKAMEKKASMAEKLMKAAGVEDPELFQQQLDAYEAKKFQDQGIDPQAARLLVAQQRKIDEMERKVNRQQFDVEVATLKKDGFFADIDDWRDELEPIALRTGQTLEQAYLALRGRDRMKEYEREIEQRNIANRTKKQSAKVNTSASGGSVKKSKVELTADEMAIAKLAGIKPEEYHKYKKKG